jgi:CCR4-NOT transcription complex subunit 1
MYIDWIINFQAILDIEVRNQHAQSVTNALDLYSATNSSTNASLEIFKALIVDLDTEGRYLFLNAVANQLRYPNTHTHYFSFVILYLFAELNQVHINFKFCSEIIFPFILNISSGMNQLKRFSCLGVLGNVLTPCGLTWQEIIQEQITRVLLERLIVNRPHPWGLLITFIELIKVFFFVGLHII